MIAIKVQQYLTAEGHRFFPEWITEAGGVLNVPEQHPPRARLPR